MPIDRILTVKLMCENILSYICKVKNYKIASNYVKMTRSKKVIIVISSSLAALIFGFILGRVIPNDFLKPEYSHEEILTKSQYFTFVTSITSAVITLFAVLVALFKDDLRDLWKRPIIKFNLPENNTIEHTLESEESNTPEILKATKYLSRIEIENTGNLSLLNSQVFLEKLEFTSKGTSIKQNIECSGIPLSWNGDSISSLMVPRSAKKLINIVEVRAPEKISTPNSAKENKPPRITIGNLEQKDSNGKWEATFTVYAQNHKAKSVVLVIEWNGVWANRLTEMSKFFNIKNSI